jgi:hypothetical protein
VHLEFCEVAIAEDGVVRSAGRIQTTPKQLSCLPRALARMIGRRLSWTEAVAQSHLGKAAARSRKYTPCLDCGPVERVAVITDIHANLLALEAVLEAIARTGVDRSVAAATWSVTARIPTRSAR